MSGVRYKLTIKFLSNSIFPNLGDSESLSHKHDLDMSKGDLDMSKGESRTNIITRYVTSKCVRNVPQIIRNVDQSYRYIRRNKMIRTVSIFLVPIAIILTFILSNNTLNTLAVKNPTRGYLTQL